MDLLYAISCLCEATIVSKLIFTKKCIKKLFERRSYRINRKVQFINIKTTLNLMTHIHLIF